MAAVINLEQLTGEGRVQNLSGRLRGLAARELFRVDELDGATDVVEVRVPEYVYSVTPSFFQGLFGGSVQALGSDAQAFRQHFRFIAPAIVLQQLERGLSAALTSRNLNDIH